MGVIAVHIAFKPVKLDDSFPRVRVSVGKRSPQRPRCGGDEERQPRRPAGRSVRGEDRLAEGGGAEVRGRDG